LRNGKPHPARFNDVVGSAVARALTTATRSNPRVAIYGELVALLSEERNHAGALALERMWNELIATHPISLHCGYPMQSFGRIEDAEAFREICEAHTAVVPVETYPVESDEHARRQATALLQQRSEVLEHETVERSRIEVALRARERELTAALASRDEFLIAAAHELKTPVTSLRVYSQLLQRDLVRKKEIETERLASALQAIERQTSQLTYLVGQLVDIAQIESGTLRLDRVARDLVALIKSAVAEQRRVATHEIVVEGAGKAVALIDPRRIRQVVTILLTNALKFSPAGSRITVRVEPVAGGIVRFSVTDQGSGIESEQREQIFERFHQAHGQRHLNGLGLGLFVARQIVAQHGGSIRVEDSELPGVRFVVEFPAKI
jgi:signal transduction histidine kinase